MPTYGHEIGQTDEDGITHLPDGRRFYRGTELKPDDEICRCGINKHKGSKNRTALELEQELAAKMAKQILKEIDDEIIANLVQGQQAQTFDSFGRLK